MNIYKLGTIWGKGNPDFYNLIKSESISISHTNDCYPEKESIILIAKGFTIKAITILLEDCHPVTDNLDFEDKFEPFKVDYDENVLFAKSKWIELEEKDFFQYKTQDGICQIHKPEIHKITKNLILKYTKNDNMKEFVTILEHKNQIILQGPPGTGKTYTAKDIAEQMICNKISSDKTEQSLNLDISGQYKLIQFHPAYSYEDFVRGIVAESNGVNIEYKTKNKLLADFAKLALSNFENSKKDASEFSKEKWIDEQFRAFIDHIEDLIEKDSIVELTGKISIINLDIDAFRYKGKEGWQTNGNRMQFSDIKKAYLCENKTRQDIKKNNLLSGLARHHASYYIRVLDLFKKYLNDYKIEYKESKIDTENLKPFILIIDEINRANLPAVLGELIYALEYRGESVESMYDIDEDRSLILPPNLYIIGTMNTADRSVGHLDYAIRRRFAFVDILPSSAPIDEVITDLETKKRAKELYNKVARLFVGENDEKSKYLQADFEPKDVQLGHSYFLADSMDKLELKRKYEIIPILLEYVKDGILSEDAKFEIDSL